MSPAITIQWCFELRQGGMTVAEGSGSDEAQIHSEGMHYAMMYAQDGPVELRFYSEPIN